MSKIYPGASLKDSMILRGILNFPMSRGIIEDKSLKCIRRFTILTNSFRMPAFRLGVTRGFLQYLLEPYLPEATQRLSKIYSGSELEQCLTALNNIKDQKV